MNNQPISRQKQISLFTMRIYFYKGYTTGIPFTSWKNEVNKTNGKTQHLVAFDSILKLASETFAGKFKRCLLYDNTYNIQIYQNDAGTVTQRCNAYFDAIGSGTILAKIKYDHFEKDASGKVIGENVKYLDYSRQLMQDHIDRNNAMRFELLDELNAGKKRSDQPAKITPNPSIINIESATIEQLSNLSKKFASK